MRNKLWMVALALIVALGVTGCATKKYVRQETGAVGTRVDEVSGQVEEAQTRLDTHDRQIGETSKTAQEALQRAIDAGKLAEGKLLYETVLTDDREGQRALEIWVSEIMDLLARHKSTFLLWAPVQFTEPSLAEIGRLNLSRYQGFIVERLAAAGAPARPCRCGCSR